MSTISASIVVLNYNGAIVLTRCIESLLRQSYSNFEVVIVDNNSNDGSEVIAERYAAEGKVRAVRNQRNLGVAQGRNIGVDHAQGEIVAFIDNDGFAHPNWLEECVKTLTSSPSIGVVASMVFFDDHPLILNGAGGTLNLHGYGADHGFKRPFEIANIPREVLFGMGCGMVVKREVLERVGPWDPFLLNYYDDVELGIRAWMAGYQVVVAHEAWIDHRFGFSQTIDRNKSYLTERNRIRTALKYFPLKFLPLWLIFEIQLLRYLRDPALKWIPFVAWASNLKHLRSAIRIRRTAVGKRSRYWQHLVKKWGVFPEKSPDNPGFHPDPSSTSMQLTFGTDSESSHLNYGWYDGELEGLRSFRWSYDRASTLFHLPDPTSSLVITLRGLPREKDAVVAVRAFGSLEFIVKEHLTVSRRWKSRTIAAVLEPGTYEVLLSSPLERDSSGRRVGVAVSAIGFRSRT